jgi:hypothetical protein
MMGGFPRTAMKLAFGLWLTAALAFAPAATALADCMPKAPSSHHGMAPDTQAPCDTPCKHCEDDGDQLTCKGHCAGLGASIVARVNFILPPPIVDGVAAQRHVSLLAFERPPDTPPPRTFPV